MRARSAWGIAIVVALAGWHTAAAAPGTTFLVTSPSDARDARPGDGACRTVGNTCTLRAAVQEANALPGADVIDLPSGTYALGIPPLNQNDVASGDLDITESVAIRGAGAGSTVVDGGAPAAGAPPHVHGLDRLFEVLADGGDVSLTGLTLSDGYAAEHGGAIANTSTATVDVRESALTRNVAGKSGGAIDNHLGGVVEVSASTLTHNFASETGSAVNNNRDGAFTLRDSTVALNSAAAVGLDEALVGAGAIANHAELDTRGTITVVGSTLTGNRAGGGRSGAVIANHGAGAVTIDGTRFTKNEAAGDGGAVFNAAGELTVTDSRFSENAAADGGAVFSGAEAGEATILGSRFELNRASRRGGAIVSGGTAALTVRDSVFAKNTAADWGGAILNDEKGSASVHDSTFSENTALSGGGLANEGTGLVTVQGSQFTGNASVAGGVLAGGEGGGLHSNSVGEVVVSGGAFAGNRARAGGGLSNEGGGGLTITGTRFAENRADEDGGGLLIQSGAVRMVDIDVTGNLSEGELEGGGGIAYHGDKAVGDGESAALEASRVSDNRAKGPGGGIDSRGDGPLAVAMTTVAGNTATAGGGIHHVGDAPLELARSTVSGNLAEHGGGVMTDGDGETTVENSTISGNRAAQTGGGVLVSSRLTLRSSTVAGNGAASGGGIDNGGGDLIGDGAVFLANTIVAGSPTGGNCAGTITSRGGNLDSGDHCRLREPSDQPGTDPRLGPLTGDEGPTQTHPLLAGSPAQEAAHCTDLDPCPLVDQRGVERPRFARPDAGAYESGLPPGGGEDPACTGRTERPVVADADSWVSQGAPGSNFGGDAILRVESQPAANARALVRFPLPPAPPGCRLVGATLRVHASAATDGRPLEARRVAAAWSEETVTWSVQPATAGPAAAAPSGLGAREWDVLAQTLDMYAGGNHGFQIRDGAEGGGGGQSLHAIEKGADPPELLLVFDDPEAPPAPGACPTAPQRLSADRDSWVSAGSPQNNFGADSTLKVKSQGGSDSRALVRFALPALPRGCAGIASAVLRLEAASAKDGRELEVRRLAAAWSEGGVTWAGQPAATGAAARTPARDGPLDWAVTAHVREMYASGNHGFQIRDGAEGGVGDEQTLNSRDKLGDGPPELVIAFEDGAVETTIVSGPASPTRNAEATFTFSSDVAGATFECALDGGAFAACDSPHAVGPLAEGDHRLAVRARGAAGPPDLTPAVYAWTVDATAPNSTIRSGPPDPSQSRSASFAFDAPEDARFECRLDGGTWAACESPHAVAGPLEDGPHRLEVRATDRAGNTGEPAAHAWAVAAAVPDTTAPETRILAAPPPATPSTTARFEFGANEAGARFDCSLDGGPFAPCGSPVEHRGLAAGPHGFSVRATDAAGNADPSPATHAWTVVAPVSCGAPVTASATADTWLDENSPVSTKGDDSILKVQSKGPRDNFRALVRFGLPSPPSGCRVESATLRLYAASARAGRTLHALPVTAPWPELTATWASQPATGGPIAKVTSGTGYREWAVTDAVRLMDAQGNHGFLIRDAAEGADAEQQFHSREKGSQPPQLVVRFTRADP